MYLWYFVLKLNEKIKKRNIDTVAEGNVTSISGLDICFSSKNWKKCWIENLIPVMRCFDES